MCKIRPYTLEQYKSIKPDGYVEYGKLKPGKLDSILIQVLLIFGLDLNTDELKAKRANADRIKEFSKNLNSFNKQQIRSSIADSRDYGDGPEKTAVKSAREKALDFSKNVPKPKVRPAGALEIASTKHADSNNGYGTAAEEYCISADDNLIQYGMFDGIGENSRLQELQMKHGENKKKVDAIKKSLGISSNH